MTESLRTSDHPKQNERMEMKNDDSNSRIEMIPPDGGWGWVVLVGNCILMFLLPTTPVCYGVVYLALIEQQGISNTVASGITAVLLGIAAFLGPVSTAISRFYSHRKLALIGVFVMTVGLILCSFSLNITWLYFCFILIGFGNSIGTPQIFLIGQEYFTTKRVTANAVASAAYTLGYIVLPFTLINLINAFSIRGAFLVWAGIMLNGFVGAMLYQPVERHAKIKQMPVSPAVTFSDTINMYNGISYDKDSADKSRIEDKVACERVERSNKLYINEQVNNHIYDSSLNDQPNGKKSEHCNTDLVQLTEEDYFEDTKSSEEFQTYDVVEEQMLLSHTNSLKDERPCSYISTASVDSYCTAKTNFKSMLSITPSEYFDVMGSWASIQSLSEFRTLTIVDSHEVNEYPHNNYVESPTAIKKNAIKCHRMCGISFPYFKDIVNFEVLSSPVFLIIAVSSAVYRQVYYGYSSFLPVVAYQKQLEDHIPTLLLILAIAEIMSKFCTGVVADREWITARKLYMGSTLVNFSALILTGLSVNLLMMMIATFILGIGLGISSSLGPVLLIKYHSLELLQNSYGLMLFLSGATTFVLFPIQGWTIDKTGSANFVCYIFASLCLVPLILWLLMPLAEKNYKINKKSNA